MAVLVIGPTCVGKSTFLSSNRARDFGVKADTFKFGFQLAGQPAQRGDTIHYNLLRDVSRLKERPAAVRDAWSLEQDHVLFELLAAGLLTECFVLVAPVEELVRRAKARTLIEPNMSQRYGSEFWAEILRQIDLFRLYEQLFDLLERAGVRTRVLDCSGPTVIESDRAFVHAVLRGRTVHRPSKEIVDAIKQDTRLEYQSILLPYGCRTDARGYEHLSTRQSTFDSVLPDSLLGESVLDVGCAIGGLLFAAERRGASTLVGVEPKKNRYEAARRIADVLQSQARFAHSDFASFDTSQRFDHVYLLNVLHHVRDIDSFLGKAASLAKKSVTIEMATLLDQKFRTQHGLDRSAASKLNALPVIGVSSLTEADQTYVHSPAAIEKLMAREAGRFHLHLTCESSIADRTIMIFRCY